MTPERLRITDSELCYSCDGNGEVLTMCLRDNVVPDQNFTGLTNISTITMRRCELCCGAGYIGVRSVKMSCMFKGV